MCSGSDLSYKLLKFRNITREGLSNPCMLPSSDFEDSVLAVGVIPAQPKLNVEQVRCLLRTSYILANCDWYIRTGAHSLLRKNTRYRALECIHE